jgi:hypothetical protein
MGACMLFGFGLGFGIVQFVVQVEGLVEISFIAAHLGVNTGMVRVPVDSWHSVPEDQRLEDEHPGDANQRGHQQVILQIFLELKIPQGLAFCGAQLKGQGDHLSDDGGSLRGISVDSPGDGPLGNDENAHISEGAEEEDLLRKPFEEEIDIVLPVNAVEGLQEDS